MFGQGETHQEAVFERVRVAGGDNLVGDKSKFLIEEL